MLSLTRIFLHHWHRFNATFIDVDGGLCLTGPDESDSAAVLDAIQLALVGDPARARFSQSRYGFTYDLDGYARGRLHEDKWQRSGNTVSYVILEFTDSSPSNSKVTLGLCIETGPRLTPEITYFILPEALNPNTFVTKGRPLPRIELKPLLRNWRGAQYYEKPLDYQTELLNRLGGLDDRFLDLFQRALRFHPVRRADEFVFTWLFDSHPLDAATLRRMRERLSELHAESDRIEKKIAALQPVVKEQTELRRLTELRDQHTVLLALLHFNAANRRVAAIEKQTADQQLQIADTKTELDAARTLCYDLEVKLREAERLEFENGLSHRRSILQWQNKTAAQTADNIHDRWLTIQRQLKAEADGLRPLLKISGLELDELAALNGLLNQIDAATAPELASQGEPPSPTLAATLDSAIPTVSYALARIGAERTRLADRITDMTQQAAHLKLQLEPLTTELPNHLILPPHAARMQEILTPIIGKKPPLLYEFIDVPDSRWQNAVEAVLGPCRFHAIVSATWYDAAKSALLAARANEDLGDADVHDPTQAYNRPAQPRSLAEKVTTIYPDLRAYLDYMLGDTITCEWPDELRRHPRAVTPEVALHGEWQIRTVSPAEYQPIVIGKNATRLQSEARQRQAADINRKLANIGDQLAELTPRLKHAETLIRHLSHANAFAILRTALDEPLDERPARAEAAAYEAELHSLELTPVNELKTKAERLRADIARQNRIKGEIAHRLLSLEFDLRVIQNELSVARVAFDTSNAEAASRRSQFPSAAAAAEGMLPDHLKEDALSESIRLVEQKERELDKRAGDERLKLIEAISAFNAMYQLAQWPGEPTDERYAQANQRLAEVDLPRVNAQIAAAEREMEDELNDHILRPLREYLTNALRTLEQINDTLTELGAPYRLYAEPAPETKDFYAMIVEHPERSPEGAKSEGAVDALNILAHFYEVLTTQPDSASHLTDYRRYLNYSIEVKGPDGQTARFTRADDEAQIAFYMAIAASFAQVYRIHGERLGRPCIRLVPFGFLFAQMDAPQIAPALDLFNRFGLQLAAAVPLERSDYLVASLPSTIALTPVGNSVLAEPYRNYIALSESAS